MGTTSKNVQTSQFEPGSMGTYKGLQSGLGSLLGDQMSSPYGNPQFQFERQMGQQNANLQNQTNQNQLGQNFLASGMGGGQGNPAFQELMSNQMRGGTQNSAMQGFINPTQLANQRQQFYSQLAQAYRPLQTGQTGVQSTGGLGSWLPQLANMGFGLATGGGFNPGGGQMGGPGGGQINPFMSGAGGSGMQGLAGMGGNMSGFNWGGGGMQGAAPGIGSLYNPQMAPPPPMG